LNYHLQGILLKVFSLSAKRVMQKAALVLWFSCSVVVVAEVGDHSRPDHEYPTDEEIGLEDATPHIDTPHFVSYNLAIPGAEDKEQYTEYLYREWHEVDHDESGEHTMDEIAHIINEHISSERVHAFKLADSKGNHDQHLQKAEYESREFRFFYENDIFPGEQPPFEEVDTDKNGNICITELDEATLKGAFVDAKNWLDKGDKDGNGKMSGEEFMSASPHSSLIYPHSCRCTLTTGTKFRVVIQKWSSDSK
jgi:hypothetical protein